MTRTDDRMKTAITFEERIEDRLDALSPAARDVARFFRENREEVMIASAAALAARAGTSDATIVRTARALGFDGLDGLRRALAEEMRAKSSPAERVERTLDAVGEGPEGAFHHALDVHEQSLAGLRQSVGAEAFQEAVARMAGAGRIVIFGIGPSSALADYAAIQLSRFGLDAQAMTRTGIGFADELGRLRRGDLVVILAYGRVYAELAALLDETARLEIGTILLTDTLAARLRRRVNLVLPVARGRAGMFSMHTATLALIEALLVGIAAARPDETLSGLKALNTAREKVAGAAMDLRVDRRGSSGEG